MKLIMISLMILIGSQIAFTQDLNAAWLAYATTSNELVRLNSERQALASEQLSLTAETDRLQQASSWYSSWFNRLLLSGNTSRQLEIMKALTNIDSELIDLEQRHLKELAALKAEYARIVSDYEQSGTIPEELRNTAQRVGNLILESQPDRLTLPDYTGLVQGDYGNPGLRKLVLEDVRAVVMSKLGQLDSLLDSRRAAEELASRLAAFHEDLGLQLEASRDIQERDQTGEPSKNFSWNSQSEAAAYDAGGSEALDLQDRLPVANEGLPLRVGRETVDRGSGNPEDSKDLSYLEARRSEYRDLLQQINEELSESP